MKDIAGAAEGIRTQTEQAARALVDQSKAMREMAVAAQNTAKQIKLVTKANIEQSAAAASLLTSVSEIRQITDRNAHGVKQTRGGTDDLLRRAQTLIALAGQPAPSGRFGNGKAHRAGNGKSSRSNR